MDELYNGCEHCWHQTKRVGSRDGAKLTTTPHLKISIIEVAISNRETFSPMLTARNLLGTGYYVHC